VIDEEHLLAKSTRLVLLTL